MVSLTVMTLDEALLLPMDLAVDSCESLRADGDEAWYSILVVGRSIYSCLSEGIMEVDGGGLWYGLKA